MTANSAYIGAPMPGSVASLAVKPGQKVRAGNLLLTLKAMKMEIRLHADPEATVAAVYVQPGNQVEAKDLVIELER